MRNRKSTKIKSCNNFMNRDVVALHAKNILSVNILRI